MSLRRASLAALLLAVPACFDPIVGSKCADGYSPCGDRCVVTGTCAAVDAAQLDAGPEGQLDGSSTFDGTETDGATNVDGEPGDTTPDDGAIDQHTALDARATDAVMTSDLVVDMDTDTSSGPDAAVTDDAADDVPIVAVPDDAAIDDATVLLPIDADMDAADDSIGPVVLDAEGSEASPSIDADESEAAVPPDGPLVCAEPLSVCNDQCVDLALDPENCGDCNTICSSGVCNDSLCLVCGADETVCGRQCINTATDPDNCGGCGVPCSNGLCSSGLCQAAGTGRAIVIGHDYFRNRPAMNRILGNAIFLWPVSPVRVLVYEGAADATAIAGADGAIAQVAAATGRQWARTVGDQTSVPSQLVDTNVFLIYGQEGADDATLAALGTAWQGALSAFVNAGGTLIVLDGAYATNGGTVQILSQAGLFAVSRLASVSGQVCSVVARGDALASGLPRTYLCEPNSVSFTVTDTATSVITRVIETEAASESVVVHKVF